MYYCLTSQIKNKHCRLIRKLKMKYIFVKGTTSCTTNIYKVEAP